MILPKALDLAEDYLDDYLKETDGYLQIGHLLILDGQYLKARRWLTLGKNKNCKPLSGTASK